MTRTRIRTIRRCAVVIGAVLLLPGMPAAAQRAGPQVRAAVQPEPEPGALDARFLASALLPGAAQFMAGDDRWVPYVAVEAWGWISYIQQRRSAHEFAERYRDLAWQVARRVSAGPRQDGAFEYYEAMAFYPASGAFDAEPGVEGVQPERQLSTYNGDLWDLATALFSAGPATGPGHPAYEAALAYYTERAVRPEYAWAWGASNLEQQVFADLISHSDAAFRTATRYLGMILANHIVSSVDALVTARLRQLGAGTLRLEAAPVRRSDGLRWDYGIRFGF